MISLPTDMSNANKQAQVELVADSSLYETIYNALHAGNYSDGVGHCILHHCLNFYYIVCVESYHAVQKRDSVGGPRILYGQNYRITIHVIFNQILC